VPPLAVRRLRSEAVVPERAHAHDAGLDLVCVEAATIAPGARWAAPTGLAIAVPEGCAGLVVPRSGLARRHGITVANAPGLIDAGYRGELMVLLVNLGDADYDVAVGDRVAQLVIVPVWTGAPSVVEVLPESDTRGTDGFGSSGS
jgi:dUTP pyrophosphatase